jgi:A/G-specific adenine glycosylase
MAIADPAQVRRRLLRWFERHRRDLPWRSTRNPYAIWISETMLQQTQVETVIPYYLRFLRTFPTVRSLDRAPLAKVLGLWSGLGYYRRAENLKKSARILMRRYGGQLPPDYAKLRELPGVGEYTAGALLSIAFGRPHAAVDGNARRVLARVFMLDSEAAVHRTAQRLVSRSQPGELNQALMELGSTVCTHANPRCQSCPLNALCGARGSSSARETRLPRKRVQSRSVVWPLAIISNDGRLLLRRRPRGGILGGLWELPGEESAPDSVEALLSKLLPARACTNAKSTRLGEITHSITNRRICAPVFLIDLPNAFAVALDRAQWRWVRRAALPRQPTSAMTRKAVQLLSVYEKRGP